MLAVPGASWSSCQLRRMRCVGLNLVESMGVARPTRRCQVPLLHTRAPRGSTHEERSPPNITTHETPMINYSNATESYLGFAQVYALTISSLIIIHMRDREVAACAAWNREGGPPFKTLQNGLPSTSAGSRLKADSLTRLPPGGARCGWSARAPARSGAARR
jgi:hypothetical protein